MSLLGIQTFSGVSDRIAGMAQLLKFAINSGCNTGTKFFNRLYLGVEPQGDYSILGTTINSANGIDNNTISGSIFKSIFSSHIQDLQTQVVNNGAASLDNYILVSGGGIGGGAGGGIHVHPQFEDVVYQCLGSHLSAVNVFFPQANFVVATYTVVSSGVGTYASVQPVGTGASSYINGTNNFAPAKMVIVPIQTVTSATQLSLYLNQQNMAGGTTPASCNVLINAGVLSGTQFIVNTTSGQYLDCTNIIAGGGGGTDVFKVIALKEREMSL